ncbi:MAG TPA: hypothetical protein VFN55_04695 [Solirubrobacteraceae bacterium]|nr:hypothetical protein [Solirubrobacteraceae bacterium]
MSGQFAGERGLSPERAVPPTRGTIPAPLAQTGVIAILRASADIHLEAVATALALAGVRCLELTMTTPGAIDGLRRLRAALDPAVTVGMGTVTTAAQACAALDAGAEFLVSPAVCPEVVGAAVRAGAGAYRAR